MRKIAFLLVPLFLMPFTISVLADDKDDIQALIDEYCRLEGVSLTEQSKLMTGDRIMINTGRRQTDNAHNMKVQIAFETRNKQLDPGEQLIVTAVDPIIRVYGDAAVASFYRYWDYIPSADYLTENPDAQGPRPNIVTLVMVKQGGAWKIAHMHMSPLYPSN